MPSIIAGKISSPSCNNSTVFPSSKGGPSKSLGAALTLLLSAFLLIFMLYYLRVVRADQRAAMGTA